MDHAACKTWQHVHVRRWLHGQSRDWDVGVDRSRATATLTKRFRRYRPGFWGVEGIWVVWSWWWSRWPKSRRGRMCSIDLAADAEVARMLRNEIESSPASKAWCPKARCPHWLRKRLRNSTLHHRTVWPGDVGTLKKLCETSAAVRVCQGKRRRSTKRRRLEVEDGMSGHVEKGVL